MNKAIIVGNAPLENKGDLIDSYFTVIRLNNWVPDKHVGRKCDIHMFLEGNEWCGDGLPMPIKRSSDIVTNAEKVLCEKVAGFNSKLYWPSLGFSAINFFMDGLNGNLDIIGFTHGDGQHFNKEHEAGKSHDWEVEKFVVGGLIDGNLIKRVG